MADNDNLLNNDTIKTLSTLFGGSGNIQNIGNIMQMMETMKKVNTIFNMFNTPNNSKEEKRYEEPKNDIFSASKNAQVINAAIPFLDKEYQKGLSVSLKVMEMQKILSSSNNITAQNRNESIDINERRKKMLKALKPYLSVEEQNDVDIVIRAMEMKSFFEGGNK